MDTGRSRHGFHRRRAPWVFDPETNSTHLFIQFLKPNDYLMVMQFTPFVYDVNVVQARDKNFTRKRGFTFAAPFPMISELNFAVFQSDGKTPVAAGTEVLFAGWSPDIDPYAAVTDGKGQVPVACLSRFRAGQLPKGYPPVGNPLYVEIPNFNGQGACTGWVDIKDSGSTVAIAIHNGVCVQGTQLQQSFNSLGKAR